MTDQVRAVNRETAPPQPPLSTMAGNFPDLATIDHLKGESNPISRVGSMTGENLITEHQPPTFAERLGSQLAAALPRLRDAEVLDLADMLHEALRARTVERRLSSAGRLM